LKVKVKVNGQKVTLVGVKYKVIGKITFKIKVSVRSADVLQHLKCRYVKLHSHVHVDL